MKLGGFASAVPSTPPLPSFGAAEWKSSSGSGVGVGGDGQECPAGSHPPWPRSPRSAASPAGQPLSRRHGVPDSRARPQHGNVDSPPGDSSGVREFSPSVLPPPLHPLRGGVRAARARSVSRQPLRAWHGAVHPPGSPKPLCARRTRSSRSQRSAPPRSSSPRPRRAPPARSFPRGTAAAAGAALPRPPLGAGGRCRARGLRDAAGGARHPRPRHPRARVPPPAPPAGQFPAWGCREPLADWPPPPHL